MFKRKSIYLCIISALMLSGCVSQEQADAKMGKGCQAAINSMIKPKKIMNVQSNQYSYEDNEDGYFRRVTIKAMEKDGWMEREREYNCLFAEQWGLAKTTHIALLEQISYDETILGKKGGKVFGSFEDFMKLVSSAETAMGQ